MLRRGIDSLSQDFRDLAEATLDFSPLLHHTERFSGEAPLVKLLAQSRKAPIVAVVGPSDTDKGGVLDLLYQPGGNVFQRIPRENDVASLWKYRNETPKDVDLTPVAMELELGLDKETEPPPPPIVKDRYYPDPSLQFVHLMDTCGTDTDDEHKERLKEALNLADVLVIVVSAKVYKEIPLWEFLAELPAAKTRRSVVALTDADQFGDADVLKMEHCLREYAMHYIKYEPITIPVCTAGKQRGAGGNSLVNAVNRTINTVRHEQRWNKRISEAVTVLFQQQAEVLRNRSLLQHMDTNFLSDVERKIEREFNQQTQTKSLGDFRGLILKQVQDMLPSLAKQVSRQMGVFLSPKHFLAMPRLAFLIDYDFYRQLRNDVELVVNGYNFSFVSICRAHWEEVRPEILDHLKCDIGDFPEETLKKRLETYKERIGEHVYAPLMNVGLRACLNGFFKQQEKWMRTQIIFILSTIIIGDLFGMLGEHLMAVCLILFAVALWFINSIVVLVVRRFLYKKVLSQAQLIPNAVADELVPVLEEISRSEVCDYRQFFAEIRAKVALMAEEITPLRDMHGRLQNARMLLASQLDRRSSKR